MADTPDDALIEAIAQALDLWEVVTAADGRKSLRSRDAHDLARAAHAALVQHLELTEERDMRRRLLVEHNGHETEYNHMCPACNPLPNEQVWYQRRRLVSKWVEVTQP